MSVAFRRESDEEHLEPRFALPIPPGPNLVTARGLALIQGRVEALDAALRDEADEEQRKVLARDLRYWQTRRATAEIAPLPTGDVVAFGTRVRFTLDGRIRTLDIVGHDEADTAQGQIAFAAPLARVLIGAEPGERIDFAGRSEAIEVLDVAPLA